MPLHLQAAYVILLWWAVWGVLALKVLQSWAIFSAEIRGL